MATFLQSISNLGGVATVSPLHVLGNVYQTKQTSSTDAVTPSSITTLSSTSRQAPLTFDASSQTQAATASFSASGLVSGLTPAQQRQLALSLGLSPNATSADLTKAINALLTPSNPTLGLDTTSTTASDLTSVLQGLSTTPSVTDFVSGLAPAQLQQLALALGLKADATSADVLQALNTLATPANSFSGFVSGLTPAQQRQLALTLGLDVNATSADLSNAINALLSPANPGQSLIDILVGGTSTGTTSPIVSGLVLDESEIGGVPASTPEEILGTLFTTLFGIATTSNATAPATVATQTIATTNAAASAATAVAISSAATVATVPTTATATTTAAVATLPATVAAAVTPATTTAVTTPATAAAVPTTTTTATAPLTTVVTTTTTPAAATVAVSTPATVPAITSSTTTTATTATAATNELAATAAAATVAATAANSAAALLAQNASPAAGNLPTTGVAAGQATPIIAPTVAEAAPPAPAAAPEEEFVSILTAVPAPELAAPTINATTLILTNANDVLQTLLADAAAHALITSNLTAATYSVAGVINQLNAGVDHTRQADLSGTFPDIRDTLNPITHVAATRDSLERQT